MAHAGGGRFAALIAKNTDKAARKQLELDHDSEDTDDERTIKCVPTGGRLNKVVPIDQIVDYDCPKCR